jgi:hypothetical protein
LELIVVDERSEVVTHAESPEVEILLNELRVGSFANTWGSK